MTILDHPSQNLEIIYFPAMLQRNQWPKESCYVANTLFLYYEWNFLSDITKSPLCSFPWWMQLQKKTRLAEMYFLGRNRLPGQEKAFQKLFSLQNSRFCFTSNSQLCHICRQLLYFTRAHEQKCSGKVLAQQPKQENGRLPP